MESIDDLLEEIPQDLSPVPVKPISYPGAGVSNNEVNPPSSPQTLDDKLVSLLKCLDFIPTTFDSIVARSGFAIAETAVLLSRLELAGLIVREGGRYSKINNGVG